MITDPDEGLPYSIKIPIRMNFGKMKNIVNWCLENFGNNTHELTWSYGIVASHTSIWRFKNIEDATLFELTWS